MKESNFSGYGSSGAGAKIPVLIGAVVALMGASGYNVYQINQLRSQLAETRALVDDQVAQAEDPQGGVPLAAQSTAETMATIQALKEEVEAAREHAATVAGEARVAAAREANVLEQKLAAAQEAQAQEAAKIAANLNAVSEQVTAVRSDASTNRAKVAAVSNEVAAVREQAESTKTELQRTIAALTSTQGDLGIQSGLIATNAKQLAALREQGERNYTEFRLPKSKSGQRVGDLQIRLTKTDSKKNKYTVEVIVDDKLVEKKDRTVNEPVQFLMSRYRQPLELVVNEVRKDTIVGYLATPKVMTARN